MNIEKPDKPEFYPNDNEHFIAQYAERVYRAKLAKAERHEQLRTVIGQLRDLANEIDRVADNLERSL